MRNDSDLQGGEAQAGRGRVLPAAGIGGLVGAAAAFVVTYLPLLLAGDGYEEHLDALVTFVVVLTPLGAILGAFGAAARRRPPGGRTRARTTLLVAALLLGLGLVWQVWAVQTGLPRLF